MLFGADKRCQRELEAMRQRHKARFQEATADLRVKHKAVVKRMKVLEVQLLRNSVSLIHSSTHGTCIKLAKICLEYLRGGCFQQPQSLITSKVMCALMVQDTMLAVNEELQLNQGAVTDLKSSMKEVYTCTIFKLMIITSLLTAYASK